jgi:hypothetical protein
LRWYVHIYSGSYVLFFFPVQFTASASALPRRFLRLLLQQLYTNSFYSSFASFPFFFRKPNAPSQANATQSRSSLPTKQTPAAAALPSAAPCLIQQPLAQDVFVLHILRPEQLGVELGLLPAEREERRQTRDLRTRQFCSFFFSFLFPSLPPPSDPNPAQLKRNKASYPVRKRQIPNQGTIHLDLYEPQPALCLADALRLN